MSLKFNPAPMPVEELRALLSYDPETGLFRWKVDRLGSARGVRAGDPAGSPTVNGYIVIGISGKNYKAHRLAWYLVMEVWPPDQIDHKNRVRGDNRIANLRLANKIQNGANMPGRRAASGYRGVYRHYNKWKGVIRDDYRLRYLGLFDTPEEAYAAVCAAIQETRGEFARVD